jgi:hypothetical protein
MTNYEALNHQSFLYLIEYYLLNALHLTQYTL